MRPWAFILEMAAALIWALLLFAGPVNAQTISNTARVSWSQEGAARSALSNTIDIDVDPQPAEIETYHPVDNAAPLSISPSQCGGNPLFVFAGQSGGAINVASARTSTLAIGEVLILRFWAPAANLNPSIADSVSVTITGARGDREVIAILETGLDTGIFTGSINTLASTVSKSRNDCRLSVEPEELVEVAVGGGTGLPPVATTLVAILADPYGLVFDSDDGTPVSGARVSLVDAQSGAPATVFADDGVTPWPSSVVTGAPIVDGAGVSHPMGPGEYRFPNASLGNYRIIVAPPSPYSAPSTVSSSNFANFRHSDGSALTINDASYGGSFALTSITPVRIDIPVDRPKVPLAVTKSASRPRAEPGDAVFYSVTVRNPDPTRAKTDIVLADSAPRALRLRPESLRINGQAKPSVVSASIDGHGFTAALGSIPPNGSVRVTYAMVVREDAAPGQAVNHATVIDASGTRTDVESSVVIEHNQLISRMTITGRVMLGDCRQEGPVVGIPGVRVMLEDGSFAITDREGRYHFDGVVPGTHVVQAQTQTLPGDGHFVDCHRSTRSAGSAISRFVSGQGGSLAVADFHAVVPGSPQAAEVPAADGGPTDAAAPAPTYTVNSRAASGAETDWMALGDGPTEFLFPNVDHNPRSPAVRVVIRHRAGQKIELFAGGKAVGALALDGTKVSANRTYAVSAWRAIPLTQRQTVLRAIVRNPDGTVATELVRDVQFVSAPWRAELVKTRSHLVADGKSRPVVAVKFTDRRGRPVRAGVTGTFAVSEPFQSAAMLDQLQLGQLTGRGSASANWTIEGDKGVALIELAPKMVSGPLRLDFQFADGGVQRRQELESWVVPGDLDWTIIGLAEGSIGAKSVADNMERTGEFDSDFGDDARVALYAKGSVLGRFLMTLAYDSAKQKDDQRLLGAIDPKAYYTVFADGSDRRFDAAGREKLYVRIETKAFYALYGDFLTGFDQTVLAQYRRTATGAKVEGRVGKVHGQAFAAKVASRHRHDEIQGNGLSGPYQLRDRDILANSEVVSIEVRDRFRSEIVVSRRELVRFLDYDIDLLAGTISFKQPVLSRDFDLNPQFIVIDYEVFEASASSAWNAGARIDYTFGEDVLRFGATVLTDKGQEFRTELAAVDLRARIGDNTEIRAELAVSRKDGREATAWLVEAEHRTGAVDLIAYVRSVDADFGIGQVSGAEVGRRKFGFDARLEGSQKIAYVFSAWYDDSVVDSSSRQAVQATGTYRTGQTEARLGIAKFADKLSDGTNRDSTVVEVGVSQRLLGNKLELSATSSVAIDGTESADLPERHRLRASYAVTDWARAVGTYEIARGDTVEARTFNAGFELTPWQGSRALTSVGRQIDESGQRTYAAFGLAQTLPVAPSLTIDATIDGNRELGGFDRGELVNPDHPLSSGGHIVSEQSLFEDFTAITLGGSWRHDAWSATVRGEYRDGESVDRKGVTASVIRQLADGVVVGGGGTWTKATANDAATSEIMDAALALAYRPSGSEISFLGKLQYRSDRVAGAVLGEPGPVGSNAVTVGGDAKSQRLLASLSTNWSPYTVRNGQLYQRSEPGMFLGLRRNLDRIEDFDLAGTTLLGGLDARLGIGERFEIGGSATIRANVSDGTTSFAIGPQIGFTPADNTLVTLGYNMTGFRDRDFSEARETDKGLFASIRMKFDSESLSFLGLGRRR
ncbi:hypothetical protein N0B51_06495 [Tsuneonella sp. YG55]|uniref:DUF11 domain-containing protein n=1 Tax=Tsuneonella litorea TaxID=2976475 RepID=A0A9X2W289_9SPHN|nr:hypothetical protein [Tsuneonella litorea]MCT2558625.1 hypothetical protein [Tsuneonella litorea]